MKISKQLFQTKSADSILKDLHSQQVSHSLKKTLTIRDLTAFGVAALVGAGVFSTIGNAAAQGGPAVVFLFIFTAVACAFSAFCYAEFASSLPIAGSSYSYAYASFGELIAWIIGWDLLLEYAISNIVVAISWSQYFCSLLSSYGIHLPPFLTLDYSSAIKGYEKIQAFLDQGISFHQMETSTGFSPALLKGYLAWTQAPQILGLPLICDLPALGITILITWIVFLGIQESKTTSNLLVLFKIIVILIVMSIGAFYIQPSHWVPFAPNGVGGILKGVSAVFFAYIGFDAISSTAEECQNPQRDLPRSMIYSLIICTLIYSLMALVLTGVMNYQKLGVGDPLALIFGPEGVQIPWMARLVEISAVVALSTVLLVYQIGQPRIWMTMSRDGLLPPLFSAIHPVRKTPWFSTLFTGLVVAIPTFFMNQNEVTDLASMGTLFAFMLVCGGILKLNPLGKKDLTTGTSKKFVIPYLNAKYTYPGLIFSILLIFTFFSSPGSIESSFKEFLTLTLHSPLKSLYQKIPTLFFYLEVLCLMVLSFRHSFSLIPVLGLTSCGYLMSQLEIQNWTRFIIWILVGILIYFCYGIRHSRMRQPTNSAVQ